MTSVAMAVNKQRYHQTRLRWFAVYLLMKIYQSYHRFCWKKLTRSMLYLPSLSAITSHGRQCLQRVTTRTPVSCTINLLSATFTDLLPSCIDTPSLRPNPLKSSTPSRRRGFPPDPPSTASAITNTAAASGTLLTISTYLPSQPATPQAFALWSSSYIPLRPYYTSTIDLPANNPITHGTKDVYTTPIRNAESPRSVKYEQSRTVDFRTEANDTEHLDQHSIRSHDEQDGKVDLHKQTEANAI